MNSLLSLSARPSAWSLILLISVLSACGPRFKTPQMVAFEQQKATPALAQLKLDCPDLINDSLKYYARAHELHEDNEPEESEHFLTMASITWRIAEKRSAFLRHRQKMSDAKARYDRAQLLLADTQRRKEALLNMKATRDQRAQRALAETSAQAAQREAIEEQLKVTIQEVMKAKADADAYSASMNASALYNKGLTALKAMDTSARAGQVTSALSIAKGAVQDFQAALEAAKPAFEKQRAQEEAQVKMRELLKRARSFPSSEVTPEGRGVVLSLRGLYRKGKLVGSKRFLIERVAELINEFGGLRVMIEAHTSKHKKRRAALAKTERMAEEVLTLIKPLIKDPDLRMNTLGRGDYAPISSNPRSVENERIDIVFFNPRLP